MTPEMGGAMSLVAEMLLFATSITCTFALLTGAVCFTILRLQEVGRIKKLAMAQLGRIGERCECTYCRTLRGCGIRQVQYLTDTKKWAPAKDYGTTKVNGHA